MVRALIGTLTLCLALGITSLALGQDRQPPKEAPLGLLSIPDVQKELKLSDEQIGKLKDGLGKLNDKIKDEVANFQKLSPEEQQKKAQAFNEQHNKAIAGVLDAKQWKRFKQIQWQLNDIGALQDPDLQKELKMSDEQKKKIDGVFNDANRKSQEMQRSGERSPEKWQALQQDVRKKANDVLSDEQKKNYKELQGPQFQFARPAGGK